MMPFGLVRWLAVLAMVLAAWPSSPSSSVTSSSPLLSFSPLTLVAATCPGGAADLTTLLFTSVNTGDTVAAGSYVLQLNWMNQAYSYGLVPSFSASTTTGYKYQVPFIVNQAVLTPTFCTISSVGIYVNSVLTNAPATVISTTAKAIALPAPVSSSTDTSVAVQSLSTYTYTATVTRSAATLQDIAFEFMDVFCSVVSVPVSFQRGNLTKTIYLPTNAAIMRVRLTYAMTSVTFLTYTNSSGVMVTAQMGPTNGTWTDRITLQGPSTTSLLNIMTAWDGIYAFTLVRAVPDVTSIVMGSLFDSSLNPTSLSIAASSTWDPRALHMGPTYTVPFRVTRAGVAITSLTTVPSRMYINNVLTAANMTVGLKVLLLADLPLPLSTTATTTNISLFTLDGWFNVTIQRLPSDVYALDLQYYYLPSGGSATLITTPVSDTVVSSLSPFDRSVQSYDFTIPLSVRSIKLFIGWTADPLVSVRLLNGTSGAVLDSTLYTPIPAAGGYLWSNMVNLPRELCIVQVNSSTAGVYSLYIHRLPADVVWAKATGVTDTQIAGIDPFYSVVLPALVPVLDIKINGSLALPYYTSTVSMSITFSVADTATATDAYGTSWPMYTDLPNSWNLLSGWNNFTIESLMDGFYIIAIYRTPPEVQKLYIALGGSFELTTPMTAGLSSLVNLQTLALASPLSPYTALTFSPGTYPYDARSPQLPWRASTLNVTATLRSKTVAGATSYPTMVVFNTDQTMISKSGSGSLFAGPFSLNSTVWGVGRPLTVANAVLRLNNSNDGFYKLTLQLAVPDVNLITWFSQRLGATLTEDNSIASTSAVVDGQTVVTSPGQFFTYGASLKTQWTVIEVGYNVTTIQLLVNATTSNTTILCLGTLQCQFATTALVTAAKATGRILYNLSSSNWTSPLPVASCGVSSVLPPANNPFSIYSHRDGIYNYVLNRRGPDVLNWTIQFRNHFGAVWTPTGAVTPAFVAGNGIFSYTYSVNLPASVTAVRFSVNLANSSTITEIAQINATSLIMSNYTELTSNDGNVTLESSFTQWFDLEYNLNIFVLQSAMDGTYDFQVTRTVPQLINIQARAELMGGFGLTASASLPVESLAFEFVPLMIPNENATYAGSYDLYVPYRLHSVQWMITSITGSASVTPTGGSSVLDGNQIWTKFFPLTSDAASSFLIKFPLDEMTYPLRVFRQRPLVKDIQIAYASSAITGRAQWSTSDETAIAGLPQSSANPWLQVSPLVWNATQYDRVVFAPSIASFGSFGSTLDSWSVGTNSTLNVTQFNSSLSAVIRDGVNTIVNMPLVQGVNTLYTNSVSDGSFRLLVVRKVSDLASVDLRVSATQSSFVPTASGVVPYNTTLVWATPFVSGATGTVLEATLTVWPISVSTTPIPQLPTQPFLFVTMTFSTLGSLSIGWDTANPIATGGLGAGTQVRDSRTNQTLAAMAAGASGQNLSDMYANLTMQGPIYTYTALSGLGAVNLTRTAPYEIKICSAQDGNYTIRLTVQIATVPALPAGVLTLTRNFTQLYTGETSALIAVTANRLPANFLGLTLLIGSTGGTATLSTSSLHFAPRGQSGAPLSLTFTLIGPSTVQLMTVSFAISLPTTAAQITEDLDLYSFSAPAQFSSPIIQYPAGYWGLPTPSACTCNTAVNSSTCDSGPYGTGTCTCIGGFTGTQCLKCKSGYAGTSCQACPRCLNGGVCNDGGISASGSCNCTAAFGGDTCERCLLSTSFGTTCTGTCPACVALTGTCDAGITGTGVCVCVSGWQGTLCDTIIPGALVAYPGVYYGADSGVGLVIEFNATVTTFGARILTLPALGTLFQTSDGKTASSAITAVPATVTHSTGHVIYFPPSTVSITDLIAGVSTAYTTFTFQVTSSAYTAASPAATAYVRMLHSNTAPTLVYDVWPALTVITRPTSGLANDEPEVTGTQATTLSIGIGVNASVRVITADSDVATSSITLRMIASTGYVWFDSSLVYSAGLDSATLTLAQSFLALSASSALLTPAKSLTLSAPLTTLNGVLTLLTYTPRDHLFYGEDILTTSISDNGNTVITRDGVTTGTAKAAAALSDARYLRVWITQVNQQISIVNATKTFKLTLPSGKVQGVSSFGGVIPSLLFTGEPTVSVYLQLVDVDAYNGNVLVRITLSSTAQNGGSTLSLPNLPAGGPDSAAYAQLILTFTSGSGYGGQTFTTPNRLVLAVDYELEFQAPLSTLNALLSNITYTPGPRAAGTEKMTIYVNDQGNTCGTLPCPVTTATTVVSFTIPHRERAPLPLATLVTTTEGAIKSVLTLTSSNPNAGGNSTSIPNSTITYTITSAILTTLSTTSGSTVQNWGTVGFVSQYVNNTASGPSFGVTLFPSYASSALSSFSPKAVTDAGGRLMLKLVPYFYGTSLLQLTFTCTKKVATSNGTVSMAATTNATLSIDVTHVNHAPFIYNSLLSSATSVDASVPIYFDQSFYAETNLADAVINLTSKAGDNDLGDFALLRFWVSQLPAKGSLYQVDDTLYDQVLANLLPSNTSVRGDVITSIGVEVTSTHHLMLYVPPTNDATLTALHTLLNAVSTTDPLYTTCRFVVTDQTGMAASVEGQIDLNLALPVVPLLPDLFNITSVEDLDFIVLFQPVASQLYSLNLSAVTLYTLPTKGDLYTYNTAVDAGLVAYGNARLAHITSVPYTLYAADLTLGASYLTLIYAPPSLEHGTPFDQFEYDIVSADGVRSDGTTYCVVTLEPVNHAPVSITQTYTDLNDGTAPDLPAIDPNVLTLNGTDADNDVLISLVRYLPIYGSLYQLFANNTLGALISSASTVVTDPGFRVKYVPQAGLARPFFDSFLYTLNDGLLSSAAAQVSLLIGVSKMPPVASNGSATVTELDTVGVQVAVAGTDPKGLGSLVFFITRMPLYGTLFQISGAALSLALTITGVSTTNERKLVYIPSTSRGYGVAYDSFAFSLRDSAGLAASNEGTISINVTHKFWAAEINSSPTTRYIFQQDSTNNRILLNVSLHDSTALAVVILRLPTEGGTISACSTVSPVKGVTITTSMLPYIAYAGACTSATGVTGSRTGAVRLYYTPYSRKSSDSTLNDGILESFQWAAYDPTTFSSLYVAPLSTETTTLTQAEINVLVAASPSVATLNLQVNFVSYPPYAYNATYSSTILNAPIIITLSGADTYNSLPVRAVIGSLPLYGTLFQIDGTTAAAGAIVTTTNIGTTSVTGQLIYQPPFNGFQVDQINFFVVAYATAALGAIAVSGGAISQDQTTASTTATITIKPYSQVLPALITKVSVPLTLDQNTRSLIQFPILSLDASGTATKPSVVITALPSVGDVYQVRSDTTLGLDFTAWLAANKQASLVAQAAAAAASARRRLLTTTSDDTTLNPILRVQSTTTAPDGSVIALSDIDLTTFPAASSWTYSTSSGSIMPPVAYSTSATAGDAAGTAGTVRVNQTFPYSTGDIILAEQLPCTLTHPDNLLLYVPQKRQSGLDAIQYMLKSSTTSSTVSSTGTIAAASVVGSLAVTVAVIFLPPEATSFAAPVAENTPQVIVLQAVNGNDGTLANIQLLIETLPVNGGIICQLTPTTGSTSTVDRPCGTSYGAAMSRGTQVADANFRVVYSPPTNKFGTALETLVYQVVARDPSDATVTATVSATVTFTVTHVNQPPVIANISVALVPASQIAVSTSTVSGVGTTSPLPPGTTPSQSDPTSLSLLYSFSNYTSAVDQNVSVPLLATDPDPLDTADTLRYFVWRIRGSKGRVHAHQFTDGNPTNPTIGVQRPIRSVVLHDFTASAASQTLAAFSTIQTVQFASPIEVAFSGSRQIITGVTTTQSTFVAPYLTFEANGVGGLIGSPDSDLNSAVLVIDYYVMDRSLVSSSNGTVAVRIDCGQQIAATPIVFTTNGTSSILVLPTSTGAVPQVWSNVGSMCAACPTGGSCSTQGLFYPSSIDGYWRSDRFDMRGLGVDETTGTSGALIFLPCTPSTACLATPFFTAADNAAGLPCATGFSSRLCAGCKTGYFIRDSVCVQCSNTTDSVIMVLAIGIPVVLIGAAFFILLARMKLPFTWIGVTIDTFMLIATLKNFALDWPVASSSMFSSFGVLLVNLDMLQLECQMPEVQYQQKWYLMMLIPIAITAVVIVFGLVTAIVLTFWRAVLEPARVRAQQSAAPMVMRLGSSNSAAAHAMRVEASLVRERSRLEIWNETRTVCQNIMLKAIILMLKTLYLTISIKAQEPLKCTVMADGSLSLDAQPSLSCDDPWYNTMRPIAAAASIVYAAGIPLCFAYILFMARPASPSTHLWCRIFRCPVRFVDSWKREAFHKRVTLHRVDGAVSGQAELDTHAAVAAWANTYASLTEDFSSESFYWSVVKCIRSASLSVIAIWLGGVPLWQGTSALMVLYAGLALQVHFRPYKAHSRVNTLEAVGLSALIGILFCGLLMYSRNATLGHDWIPSVLDTFITGFTACIGLAVLALLNRHMVRYRFYDDIRGWCGCAVQRTRSRFWSEDDGQTTKKKVGRFAGAKYSYWFSAPAPATEVERQKAILDWMAAVPGLEEIDGTTDKAKAYYQKYGRRQSLMVNDLPFGMHGYLDAKKPYDPNYVPPPTYDSAVDWLLAQAEGVSAYVDGGDAKVLRLARAPEENTNGEDPGAARPQMLARAASLNPGPEGGRLPPLTARTGSPVLGPRSGNVTSRGLVPGALPFDRSSTSTEQVRLEFGNGDGSIDSLLAHAEGVATLVDRAEKKLASSMQPGAPSSTVTTARDTADTARLSSRAPGAPETSRSSTEMAVLSSARLSGRTAATPQESARRAATPSWSPNSSQPGTARPPGSSAMPGAVPGSSAAPATSPISTTLTGPSPRLRPALAGGVSARGSLPRAPLSASSPHGGVAPGASPASSPTNASSPAIAAALAAEAQARLLSLVRSEGISSLALPPPAMGLPRATQPRARSRAKLPPVNASSSVAPQPSAPPQS